VTGKLAVRDRIALLFDEGSFVEDGRCQGGVITGRGAIDGRPAIVIADDPTGHEDAPDAPAVRKVARATESALRDELPVFWFVDAGDEHSADEVQFPPGRHDAGRVLRDQAALSGRVAQICCLFGPAGSQVFVPALADVVIMVDGSASMTLGGPGLAELVAGERVSLEELGGAHLHCAVSGTGDLLAPDDAEAIELARLYFSYVPSSWREPAPAYLGEEPAASLTEATVPADESRPFDIHAVIDGVVDDGSFFELKPLFAPQLVIGYGRLDGRTTGIVANNSAAEGGVLCSDSADKAARFVRMCDAYGIPLVHLVDVPGFVVGSEAERGGIIRHGAKLISAVAAAAVPQLCVVVRRAYGAGGYAMCGPGLGAQATIALPTARISGTAAHTASAQAGPERPAPELIVDAVVDAADLRTELLRRLAYAGRRDRGAGARHRAIPPV